jgi:radical SAM-linked protein
MWVRQRRKLGWKMTTSSSSLAAPETIAVADAAPQFRYRIRFGKQGAMRYAGHLDLQRVIERTFRRAKIGLCYSNGFHAHPRFQIASALPLGCTSEGELIDAWLTSARDPGELLEQLAQAAPPGLLFYEAREISAKERALPAQLLSAWYEIALPGNCWSNIVDRVEALLAQDRLPRRRRGKDYDLRPLIEALTFGQGKLSARLASREGATGRPEEVLSALGLDPAGLAVHRLALVLAQPEQTHPVADELESPYS